MKFQTASPFQYSPLKPLSVPPCFNPRIFPLLNPKIIFSFRIAVSFARTMTSVAICSLLVCVHCCAAFVTVEIYISFDVCRTIITQISSIEWRKGKHLLKFDITRRGEIPRINVLKPICIVHIN